MGTYVAMMTMAAARAVTAMGFGQITHRKQPEGQRRNTDAQQTLHSNPPQ
jgi:hypothetical protein